MTDKQLFDELVKRNILDKEEANKVLRGVEASGRSAEEILYDDHMADEEEVIKVKGELLGVPYRLVDSESISDELMEIIPYETSRTYRVVPIEKKGDMLVVGMLNPDDEQAQNAIKFIAKQKRLSLGIYLIVPSLLKMVWRRYMPYESEIQSAVKEVSGMGEKERVVGLEETVRAAEEAPIIKIVASTLKHAVDVLASDIHIEPQRSRLRVRLRIDGDLHETASLPVGLSQPIISRVKVLARLRLDETRRPQDGRFSTTVFGRGIDFRVATFPTQTGEKVAIRVLDSTTGMKSLEELGLKDYNFKILEEGIEAPYGMILITGPTGSGKTTTLYSVMNRLNSEEVNVLSLEDPVEYFIDGVNQSQVLPEIDYNFASGLRQILRQDPDIIMVGEIRDSETASLAVNAALTGHLMLSTLHTNNSVGVIPRLIDLGVPSFLLPSALNIMVAQRLVSKLCPDCKKERVPRGKVRDIIEREINDLRDDVKRKVAAKFSGSYKVFDPEPKKNCEVCGGKGTVGRIALFEIFRMTKELGDIITAGFTENKLQEEAARQGLVTLRQDGVIKALEGEVLIEEVLRETE